MEITIIGWYGTETIGDRAILAGILNLISCKTNSFSIHLGSLYPFFTERTIYEDFDFYKSISGGKLSNILIFNSKNPSQLKSHIKSSDLLMVGGGPLMDLSEMYMLEYAFCYAKKKRIKSVLFGCGWGPLKTSSKIEIADKLVDFSDGVIFRDEISKNICLNRNPDKKNKIFASIDPAIFACDFYMQSIKLQRSNDYIAINFRDVSLEGNHYANSPFSNNKFVDFVESLSLKSQIPIKLIPMHYFFIGGDDRVYLNEIKQNAKSENVIVQHMPLSLKETMEAFYNAKVCIGMRFHSIVLQTILNGNNYILDYTDPQSGKIIGLIKALKMEEFYKERYCSIYDSKILLNVNLKDERRYTYSREIIEEAKEKYVKILDCLL